MLSAPPANLEASLLQRWFPVSPPGSSTVVQPKRFSETDLRGISDVLQRVGRGTWSRIPRIFTVLRLLDRLDEIDLFLAQAISDVYFPFTHQTLPQSLNPSAAHAFLQVQYVVLSSALDLERETGRHRHFSSTNDVPFIKVEELGKGAYGYVDRVISTISYKEYARKLIPRGRTFQRDQKILRDFERELGTLKKLSHHRHIVQLIGSYTDPRFVGILMSPVAECDLKDFLNNCVSDAPRSSKSFIRSFFGCLTAALSYLHDNTIRHKDIKPQNVLVSQHTVFLTDFGISLDWSEIGQSTTTGPTPRTARYCAPEVSDYAPRNSSSDMWSLGCIFLEIWTVLKGETITNLHAFLETNDTKSSCYHLNCEATSHWMKRLALAPNLADNPPQEWIRHLIVPEQRKRWTARQLLSEIETVNMNPEVKFAFSGQCCLDELESAESVISSDESFRDNGVDSAVPHPSLLATHSAHQFAEGEQPEVLSGASDSQHDIALGHADDVSPPPVTLDRQADDVLSREETPSALSEFQRRELSDENNPSVPVNVGESPEKNLNTHTLSKADLGSSGTTSQGLAVDPERSESTYPEVFLPAAQSLSEARSQDTFAERTLQPHGNFKSYPGEETFESAVDAATTTLNAPTEGFNEISILDAAEQAKQTSKLDWSTVKSKTLPLANGSEDSLHPGDIDRDGQMSTTSAYTDGPAQQHIIGAVDAQGFPLLAHSQTSNFSPSSNDRSTHPAEYMTPGPSTDYGITETNKRTMLEDESLKGAEARIIEDDMTEHSNHSKWEGHQPTANPESRTSAPPFPPSSTRSLDSPENGASQPPELSGLTSTDVVPYKPYEAPEKRTESICASCYEPLAGQFVRALSKKFHLECFTCADCNQIVASKFFPAPGKIIGGKFIAIANPPEGHTQEVPLCEYDYFRRLDLLCHSCGEALRGSYVTALEHKYHLEHFVCEEPGCGKSFGASESYFEHEEKVYCRPHYLQQYAELCHGCGTAICEQFVEIYRNGKNQHWHPECYMIHKYWNLQLKNEFAEYFAKHEHPRVNGLEVPQDLVEASMAQSSELTTQLWQVMSKFEESCATSLSDMLQQSTQPSRVKTISISAYFLFKIEGLFLALDEVERLNPLQEQAGRSIARDQTILCSKMSALFSILKPVNARVSEVSQQLLSLVPELAHYLKLLLRTSLQAAWSLDTNNKRGVVSSFLANIEQTTEHSIQPRLYEKIRDNDYVSRSAEFCYLCQKRIDGVGTGCYWNRARIFHIDCIKCPSCNKSPRVVYTVEGSCSVECSHCNYGSILDFISQNLGTDVVILHSRFLLWMHLLYVAWARFAQTVKPNVAPALLIDEETVSGSPIETTTTGDSVYSHDDSHPLPPSCPPGWKAYWSTPAKRYLFMNLQTGVSQWANPYLTDAPEQSSQEMVLRRPAPGHNPQDPESSKPIDMDQYSLALEDIPRIIALELAERDARLSSSSANALNKSTLADSLGTNSSTTSFDALGVGMPSEGKKKSSFFSKLKRKSGAFI